MGEAFTSAWLSWCRGGARRWPESVLAHERPTTHVRLDSRKRAAVSLAEILRELQHIQILLRAQEWERALVACSDREICSVLLRGRTEGFRVGFCFSFCRCTRAKSNMQSVVSNPQVVKEYLAREVERWSVVGQFELDALPEVHISHYGVIPKGHRPGKWRLIVNFSHPEGASVNDGIKPKLCTLNYTEGMRQ